MISRKTNQSSIFVNTSSHPLNTDLIREAAFFGPGKCVATLTDVNGNYKLCYAGFGDGRAQRGKNNGDGQNTDPQCIDYPDGLL